MPNSSKRRHLTPPNFNVKRLLRGIEIALSEDRWGRKRETDIYRCGHLCPEFIADGSDLCG